MKLVGTIVIVVGLVGTMSARAEEKLAPSFQQLACMSWAELEQIYRQLQPGTIPCGFTRGKAVYCPGEHLSGPKSRLTDCLWQGKHFCPDGCTPTSGTLVNQWKGIQAIRAKVDLGPSWLDGNPSLILDYRGVSHVWNDVRDEMRQVAPGLYIGAMYRGRCPQPKLNVFFILETACAGR